MEELAIKKYRILLSAPSDVFKYTKNVIKAISKFNNENYSNGIIFEQINWKDHVVPTYGDKPQKIINKQIVENSDIVIALFGTRLGTPTENHDSGTIEEIIEVDKAGGEVLTYFASGKLVNLSMIDPEQLKKTQTFKKTFNGIYREFKSTSDLETIVYEALINLSKKLKNNSSPCMKIFSGDEFGEINEHLVLRQVKFIEKLNKKHLVAIKDKIKKIQQSTVKPEQVQIIKNSTISEGPKPILSNQISDIDLNYQKAVTAFSIMPNFGDPIKFSQIDKDMVKKFCLENQLNYDEDKFFYVGGAEYSKIPLDNSMYGKEEEKQKVKNIYKLIENLNIYYGSISFLSIFQNKFSLNLVMSNDSGKYYEDITLLLEFDSNKLYLLDKLEFCNIESAEYLKDFVMDYFYPNETTAIEAAPRGKQVQPKLPIPKYTGLGYIGGPNLDYYQDHLQWQIDNIYPFVREKKGDKIILKIQLGNLKQFSSTYVCGSLILIEPINEIKFTIISKSLDKRITGSIKRKIGEVNAKS